MPNLNKSYLFNCYCHPRICDDESRTCRERGNEWDMSPQTRNPVRDAVMLEMLTPTNPCSKISERRHFLFQSPKQERLEESDDFATVPAQASAGRVKGHTMSIICSCARDRGVFRCDALPGKCVSDGCCASQLGVLDAQH